MTASSYAFISFFAFFLLVISLEVRDINRQRDNANEEKAEAKEELSRLRLGNSVEAENKAYERHHKAAERQNWRVQNTIASSALILSVIAAGGAVAGALFAKNAFVQARRQADFADAANKMNAESGRAWIAPGIINFTSPPSLAQGFSIQIQYANVGREPATAFAGKGSLVIIPISDQIKNWADFDNTVVDTCSSSKDYAGSDVAYPSAAPIGSAWQIESRVVGAQYIQSAGSAIVFKGEPYDDIVSGHYVLTVNGCAGYTTTNHRRFSRYCYLLQPNLTKPVQEWVWMHCKNGNEAS